MKFKFLLFILAMTLSSGSLADGFNGPYIGVYAGYDKAEDTGKGYSGGVVNGWFQDWKAEGPLLGLLGGVSWVLKNNIVVGLEADFEDKVGNDDIMPQKYFGGHSWEYPVNTELKLAVSARGRLGYLFNDRTLAYVTGGYAGVKVKREWHDETPWRIAGSESHTQWQEGWTAGGGLEYLLRTNISARLEYRYSDLGTANVNANLWNETYKQDLTEQAIRVGVAYRF